MDRRSFVSSVSILGVGTALTDVERLAHEAIAVAPRVPTLPKTNIVVKSRYEPIPPFDASVFARRLERARALTREAGGTVLVATSGATNFT